ncbi:hypothetical protein ACWKWU_06035 [Chitinophaga lutea]
MRYLRYIWLTLLLSACAREPRTVKPAFYWWKNRLQLSAAEQQAMAVTAAKTLYVRMFDVDIDAQTRMPVPVAPADLREPLPDSVDMVPVIFIMNTVWNNADSSLPRKLAENVAGLLARQCGTRTIREVQLDCDWTRSSRQAYFAFLEALRATPFVTGKTLSVTVRMHQVKYLSSSGIPPADKGLLMCYNMGRLREWNDQNSILNMDDLKAYTGRDRITKYPLPLDLGLPLFEWCVLFRNREYAGLLRNISHTQLNDGNTFRRNDKRRYTVLKDTTVSGYPLRRGETLRYEDSPMPLLRDAARYLSAQRQGRHDPAIILFHLDSTILTNHPAHELEELYDIFR